jgi:hypothetical protein
MKPRHLLAAVPAVLIVITSGTANAGQTINEAGALACVNDKWDVKEPEKGHKLVEYAGRCVSIPDDEQTEPMYSMECVGNYEFMPDESWKGTGTALTRLRVGTKKTRAGRKVLTSTGNTPTSTPAVLANMQALPAAARIPWRN